MHFEKAAVIAFTTTFPLAQLTVVTFIFVNPLWANQNNSAPEGLAGTNNAVAGWHYGFQSLFLRQSSGRLDFPPKVPPRCSTP